MAKISALSAATTPLTGTELLPIVQTSTKKITVADFLAGLASPITTTDTTQSTSTITGSIVTAGGLGVAKNVYVGGYLAVGASLPTSFAGTALFRSGSSGATADAEANIAVFEHSGDGGVTIAVPNANTSTLAFASPSDAQGARIRWNSATDQFMVQSANTGASLILGADNGVANVTLSGAAASEQTTAAGSVAVTKFMRLIPVGALTIASGVITATGSNHTVDTEGAGASDDLDTINGGVDGRVLIISAANDARTVVAKDGTGNLLLAGDFTMDNSADSLTLQYRGTNWVELSRSDNAA